jgi:alginate O-acetyltransferase complex protein AlgI
MTQAGNDLAAMFGIGGLPLRSQSGMYYLRSYGLVLLLSAIGATPLPKLLLRRIPRQVITALQPVALGLLLLICTAYLVDGSFNPFLYFRF